MKLIFASLIILASLYSSPTPDFLISDYDMTNQNYTQSQVDRYFKLYPKNKLSVDDKNFIVRYCKTYSLNPIFIFTQMQKEASLIDNNTTFDYNLRYKRALGYAIWIWKVMPDGKTNFEYEGFQKQVSLSTKWWRKTFDNWKSNTKLAITWADTNFTPWKVHTNVIIPKNAATYCMYQYTPFYGESIAWGHKTVGNRRFMSLWTTMTNKWEKVR